ncbi:class I SAM-dependent methyltransferase [Methylomicrobium lacus]|uniref:class I SAM-dependent methyltransferase n=1 Tax=Methylomicrobium lacus TaxID=136992 RepID=UPI0035A835CF
MTITSRSARKRVFSYLNTVVSDICCPICGFSDGRLLYTVTSAEAAQHFVLKEVNQARHNKLADHITHLWGQTTCDVVSCNCCHFIFSRPYVAGDSTFYTLAYERTGYPAWKWEYQKSADAISEIVSRSPRHPLRLIEIGAGNGAFVKSIAPDIIPKENILCFEFSEYGRNKIVEYGIKCQSDDIRSINSSNHPGQFDLICMFQVLEHMDRLDVLFKTLNSLSKFDSHLFISVPNAEQIEFNETHGCLLDMPPNHIGRWNLHGFEQIAVAFGWTLAEFRIEPLNVKDALKQQIAYRYLKISQDSSTWANKIECINSDKVRRILRIVCAGVYSLTSVKILFKAISDKNRGDSQWIHLIKTG